MVTLQELHGFIRSLNKAEKRFFKLLTATENNCLEKELKLFDFLDKIKYPGDIENKTRKEKKDILGTENVNHLYRLILSGQRNFYADSIPGFTIIDEVNNLKILFEKAQYKQCRKMLKTTKENAAAIEKFGALMQLVEIEKHLLSQEMLDDSYARLYDLLDEEHKRYRELEKNIGKYFTLYAQIHSQLKHGVGGHESYFRNILSEELLVQLELALCKKSQFLLYNCRAVACLALHDAAGAASELDRVKELMNAHSLFFHEMPRQYIDVLFHSARLEMINNPSADIPSLTALENILSSGKMPATDLNLKLRSYIFLVKLQSNYNRRSINETEDIAGEIVHFVKINENLINHEDAIDLLFAVTNYYIYTLSFSKAKETHGLLRAYTDGNNQTDVRNYSILQEYIIAFETANRALMNLVSPSLQKILAAGFFRKDEREMINVLVGLPENIREENTVSDIIENYHTKMLPDSFRDNLDLSYLNCINYLISKAGKDFSIQAAFKSNKTLSETNT